MKTLMKKLTNTNRAMTDTTRKMKRSEDPENNPLADHGGAIVGCVEGIVITVLVALLGWAGYLFVQMVMR